jgi:transcriptional regulator with XRE-family HTH domain
MVFSVVRSEVNMTTVGDRIIEARKAKDMTQLDLSTRLGVSRAAVGQWEINSTSPSIAKLEEVAMVLDVEPQWLAYSVKRGEAHIVYKSAEHDNIQWLTELTFGDEVTDEKEGAKWGFPVDYITHDLRSSLDQTVICELNSHAVEPEFEYGDKVFVDRADTKPSPSGTFAFWDGFAMAFAKMQAVPSNGTEKGPSVRISQKGSDTYQMPFGEIAIIGRVKGRMQRS